VFAKAIQVTNAKVVSEAASELGMAVVVGASESEVLHIFLDAGHTHTLEENGAGLMRCAVYSQV
jgi:hypothetical protein